MRSGKLRSAGIPGILLIFILSFSSCPIDIDSPEESFRPPFEPDPIPVPVPVPQDYPERGEMSAVTAEGILLYSPGEGGVQIDKLLDLAALGRYLNPESRQSRAGSGKTWIIKSIAGEPVVSVASGAFAPEGGGISLLVNTVKLPETITHLGESLFAGAGESLVLDVPNTVPLDLDVFVKAAEGSDITIQSSNPDDPDEAPLPILMGPPVLLSGPNVDYTNGAAVTYRFNREVTASPLDNSAGTSRWSLVSVPSGTVTVKYTGADEEPVQLGLRAEASYNGVSKSRNVPPVTVMPVTAAFERPSPAAEYSLVYYDTACHVVRLKAGDSTLWYYVKAADAPLRDLFERIYSPNAPGSADSVEAGRQAVSYTGETSRAVLSLFRITLGPDSPRVEIKGELPAPGGADKYHPLVIDIGIPDRENQGLPVFRIPDRGLGTAGTDYAYIRFRVNRGMELDIAEGGAKGNVKNGTVEVMGNGRLRDRTYEGFLGSGSVVVVRLGGYLGAGPESLFESEGYDDWLIGPAGANGKIFWGTGDQNGSYIELREDGKMAFSADITVRKSLALKYNVWFVNGPILKIDAAGDSSTVDGRKGLFAGAGGYRFYGDYFKSGGQNPSLVEAKVIVQPGNQISRSLFAGGEGYIGGPATIPNKGAGNLSAVEYGRDSIKGYPNWNIQ